MIIQCPDCQTRFQLDPDRVPRRAIRVRCQKCRYVFGIDGTVLDAAPAEEISQEPPVPPAPPAPPAPEPAAESSVESPAFDAPSAPSAPVDTGTGPAEPRAAKPSAAAPEDRGSFGLELERSELASISAEPAPAPEIELESPAATATMEPESPSPAETATPAAPVQEAAPAAPEADPKQKKARRLARALVSDILVYNRETRDRALADGTLVQALGQEIKKSWELYKEKVDPEFASDSNLFRDALNDILADGQKIF